MKKLMISTIIILPLLLLAILLVSGAIMSLITHIYVEAVEFSANDTIVLVMNDEQNPPTYNLGEQITILPLKATNRGLEYTNYDENLLQVSEDGILTPIFYGETYVTVRSTENKTATATRKIIITDKSVHKLVMSEYPRDLYEGESTQLSVSIFPKEAENKFIEWKSSDDSILQVSSNGLVTAVGNGKAIVTATSVDNQDISVKAEITCHAKLRGLVFDKTLFTTSFKEAQFPAIKTNPESCDVSFEYTSSNDDIATVDQNGKISFKKEGRVTITVRATDFKQNTLQASKEFVSTYGYYVGPLFVNKEINYNDCLEKEFLPLNFTNLEGADRQIGEIDCYVDSESISNLNAQKLISFDQKEQKFKLIGSFPEFNSFIDVVVHATVYDFETDALKTTYEDTFRITKKPTQDNVKVFNEDQELTAGVGNENEIKFSNIGEKIILSFENPDNLVVRYDTSPYVIIERQNNTIILTSKDTCENQSVYLSIGTKTYILKVSIKAKAEKLEVLCGDTQIEANETYQTLIDKLSFTITPNRDDGKEVSNEHITYQINDMGEWKDTEYGKVTLDTASVESITFKSDDVLLSFHLEKVDIEDFGIDSSFTNANAETKPLKTVETVKDRADISYILPSDIQNNLTMKIVFETENFLGGFGNDADFEKLFSINLEDVEGLQAKYTSSAKQIVISFNKEAEFTKTISMSYGKHQIAIQIVKVNLQEITFVNDTLSFDSAKDEDIHKGYQQVRVFAKHSYYGKDVDYFKVPLKALSSIADETQASLDTISWTLSRYVGNDDMGILTSQLGDTVTINEKRYKIVKEGSEYVLKDGDVIVSGQGGKNDQGYIWVDVYTEQEEGYARIYFGNFGGLSESDVYNDYFGNFDEQQNWSEHKSVDNKGGGIDIEPSKNAYAFLKVVAGDGVEGGKNCHFNFNVLQDETLVNVFDSNGYYCSSNIVLHSDLYGEGELDESGEKFDYATQNGLFLTKVDGLAKTMIYGNGYQVNFQAKNASMSGSSESDGITVNKAYNTVIKCSNPNETISASNQKMVLKMNYAYYCDLSYYYKFNPIGGAFYTKNTVFAYIPKAAIQLPYNEPLYAENITIVESGVAILLDSESKHDSKIYFKGNVEILNFANKTGLENLNGLIGLLYPEIAGNVKDYFEWQGSESFTASKSSYADKSIDRLYVNVLIFVMGNISGNVFVWKDGDYAKAEQATLSNGAKLVNKDLAWNRCYAWTYEMLDENGQRLDNAKVSDSLFGLTVSADLSQLFTEKRYIRLQCEYKDEGVKNFEHILWHMQRAYRDIKLKGVTEDHITNLKKTMQDVSWVPSE